MVLPVVLPLVRAMIELQLLTGMRSGRAMIMRGCGVGTSGTVWLSTPARRVQGQ